MKLHCKGSDITQTLHVCHICRSIDPPGTTPMYSRHILHTWSVWVTHTSQSHSAGHPSLRNDLVVWKQTLPAKLCAKERGATGVHGGHEQSTWAQMSRRLYKALPLSRSLCQPRLLDGLLSTFLSFVSLSQHLDCESFVLRVRTFN